MLYTRTANEGLVKIQYKCLVPIYVFPEMKLRGLGVSKTELKWALNFHIHVSVIDLYIPRISLPILLQPNRQTNPGIIYINRSQTHKCRNWERVRAVSFLGNMNRIFGTFPTGEPWSPVSVDSPVGLEGVKMESHWSPVPLDSDCIIICRINSHTVSERQKMKK
jgi:hypothetical protein